MSALAIEVNRLVKRFEDVVALDGLDLEVPLGQCVGLLEGLQSPTSGNVRVLGRTWARDANEIRARIGIQLQETRFHDRLTVEETVRLFRSFYERGRLVDEAIGRVQLEDKRKT